MQVTVQKKSRKSLECKIDVSFKPDNLDLKIKKKLSELRKTSKLPGFRQGKVPLSIIQNKYQDQVTWEFVNQAMQAAYREAIMQKKLHPAGTAVFEKMNYDNFDELSFTAVFEKLPEIKLVAFKKLKFDKYVPEVRDKDTEEQIEQYQNYHRTWTPKLFGSKALEGDQVIIDFVGHLENGDSFDANQATDFAVILGEKKMLPDFEQALYNTVEKEEKMISFTFPSNYNEKSLSGKKVNFKITIKGINDSKKPSAEDPEFLKSMGIEDGNLEKLKMLAKKQFTAQLERVLNNYNQEMLYEALLKVHDFSVPNVRVEEEKKAIIEEAKKSHINHSKNIEKNKELVFSDEQLKQIDETAYKRTKLSLIFMETQIEHKIAVEQNVIDAQKKQLAKQYFNDSVQALEQSPHTPQIIGEMERKNIHDQIFRKIYAESNIKEIQKNKDDLEKLEKSTP